MTSVSRRILGSAMVVGAMNAIAMIVAILRDLVFAYRFGTGEIVDAFLMGLLVPTMAVQLIGASLGVAIAPELVRLRTHNDPASANSLSSSAAIVALGTLGLISVCLLMLHQPITAALSAGFDAERTRLTGFFFVGFLPSILLQGWSSFLGGVLNSSNRFVIAALAPALRPLALCIALSVDWGSLSSDVVLLAYLFGMLAEAVAVTAAAALARISFLPRWGGMTESLRKILHEFLMVVAGSGILSVAILADQYLAGLTAPGGVAAYGYGAKIINALIAAMAIPVGVAVLPHFSALVSVGEWSRLRGVLVQWCFFVVTVSVPLVGFLWFYSDELVRLVFQRGAFSSEDAQLVSTIQMFLALQLPFYLCGILFVRVLTSLQRNRLVVLVAMVNASINVGGSLLLLSQFGVPGIALSVSAAYAVASTLAGVFAIFLLGKNLRQEAIRCDAHVPVRSSQCAG